MMLQRCKKAERLFIQQTRNHLHRTQSADKGPLSWDTTALGQSSLKPVLPAILCYLPCT